MLTITNSEAMHRHYWQHCQTKLIIFQHTLAECLLLNPISIDSPMTIIFHTGQPSLNGQMVSSLNMHAAPMLSSPPGSNHVMRGLSTPSPIESFESFVGGSCIGSPTSRVESPLNGPMKGIPLLGVGGRRNLSPSILPPAGKFLI